MFIVDETSFRVDPLTLLNGSRPCNRASPPYFPLFWPNVRTFTTRWINSTASTNVVWLYNEVVVKRAVDFDDVDARVVTIKELRPMI